MAFLDLPGLQRYDSKIKDYIAANEGVVEVATISALPDTGAAGKIYVCKANDTIYRWTGSGYTPVGSASSGTPFEGATETKNGAAGAVPGPLIADRDKFLKGDGSWSVVSNYENKTAAEGGTDVSLVTTGDKYIWNNKLSEHQSLDSCVKVTGTQDVGGSKTFTGSVTIKNSDVNPFIYFKGSGLSNNASSIFAADAESGESYGNTRMCIVEYSPTQDRTSVTGYGEYYYLPAVTTGIAESVSYNIITTKNITDIPNMTPASASAAGAVGLVPSPAAGDNLKFLRGDGKWVVPTNTTYSNMQGATSTAAGVAGLVPPPAAGKNQMYLRGDGQWFTPTNTTYDNFVGCTSSTAGTTGLVPAPAAGDQLKYLKADGNWGTPPNDNTYRAIKVNGTEKLSTSATTALNLAAGSNVSLSYADGTVTIAATNTTYSSQSAASGGTALSLVTTGEKYTWNNKASTDTKNTAGSTNTSSKIFLIGATSQAANPQTYSHDTAYVGTDGCLYSGGAKVLTAHQSLDSCVKTSGDQSVGGSKTFTSATYFGGTPVVRNAQVSPYLGLRGSGLGSINAYIYAMNSGTDADKFGCPQFYFYEYSPASDGNSRTSYYDRFALPAVAAGKTANNTYTILTTKERASSISAGSTSTNVPTSAAVASFVEGKGYVTSISTCLKTTGNWSMSGVLSITNSTASSSTTTGALKVSGGIGCAGYIYGSKVYNAVWNDYAECRQAYTDEPGYCVTETKNGVMAKSWERLQPGCKMTSDTFGTCMGETDEAKTPIAVAGRVLAYPYRDISEYHLGDAVCSAPDGKVDIMTRDEIREYPERIVGTVSEIPSYDVWYGGTKEDPKKIPVNGRIWIYVR